MSGDDFEKKLEKFRNMPEYGSLFHPPYAVRSTLGFSAEAQEAEVKSMENKTKIITVAQEDEEATRKIRLAKKNILYVAPLPYRTQEGVTR
jgi:hypothetical protein